MTGRKEVNSATDARIFSATANTTKSINVRPSTRRGGTRL